MNQVSKWIQKIKQSDKEQQLLLCKSWKSINYMGNNREKFNIVIAILKKLTI